MKQPNTHEEISFPVEQPSPGLQMMWTDEYLIRSYEAGASGTVTLPVLFQFMQETAYVHATHLGFGYHELKTIERFWVLSRLLIKIRRFPMWGEKIRLTTWPSGIEGLFAYRDFRFIDQSGDIFASAASSWLVLDSEKHRPQRPEMLNEKLHLIPNVRSMDERPSKLSPLAQPEPAEPFRVRYSDTDIYHHVNNTRYIQWIIDSYPSDIHDASQVDSFEVNFVSEAKLGDTVFIETQNIPQPEHVQQALHCIRKQEDNRVICLARAAWRMRDEK